MYRPKSTQKYYNLDLGGADVREMDKQNSIRKDAVLLNKHAQYINKEIMISETARKDQRLKKQNLNRFEYEKIKTLFRE